MVYEITTKDRLKSRNKSLFQKKFQKVTKVESLQHCSKDVTKHSVSEQDAYKSRLFEIDEEGRPVCRNIYRGDKKQGLRIKYHFIYALRIYFLSWGSSWALRLG